MKKLAVIFLLLCLVYPAYSASSTKTQADMKKKIAEYNAIAKKKSQQSKNLLSQLSRLKKDANESQLEMANLERENRRLENSVTELNSNIDSVNASMNEILAMLRGRLVAIYKKTSEELNLSLILSSSSTHDAVNTAYMLNRFAREDQAMLDELINKEHELTEARTRLKENQAQITAQTTELRRKREEFNTTIRKTDTLLKTVQSEQKKAEAAAKELENAQRAVGVKITKLMKQKTKTATKKTAAPTLRLTNTNSSQPRITSTTTPTPKPATGTVSSLSWPVRGTVTMQYGSRIHPTFKTKIFNSGIDIKAASGTPVKAAAGGEVLYQGWLRGFGQVVIIDHGGDITTVYAHLAGANVREGATVKTGTIIGRVGNSGTDSEYGLHFEVRKNGTAQNPMNYLRG